MTQLLSMLGAGFCCRTTLAKPGVPAKSPWPVRTLVALCPLLVLSLSLLGTARAQVTADLNITPSSVTFSDIASPGQRLSQNFGFSMTNLPFGEFIETAIDIEFSGESSSGLFAVSALDCSEQVAGSEIGNCFVNIEFEAPAVAAGRPVTVTDTFNVNYASEGEGSFSVPLTLNALFEGDSPSFVPAVLNVSPLPALIDFGDVVVGRSAANELQFNLTNVADNSTGAALNASNIFFSFTNTRVFELLNSSCDGDTVRPGDSIQCRITVIGSPESEGLATDEILIGFQDGTDGSDFASPNVSLRVFGSSNLLPAELNVAADPTTINFGEVLIGTSGEQTLKLSLENLAGDVETPAFYATGVSVVLSDSDSGFSVSPATCPDVSQYDVTAESVECEITIGFTADTEGLSTADVFIRYDDGTGERVNANTTVPLRARVIAPVSLGVFPAPDLLDFDVVEVGSTAVLPISIVFRNASEITVPVTLSLTDSAYKNDPVDCPDVVPGTSTCELNISYAPSKVGTNSDRLTLSYNDGVDDLPVVVDVLGVTGIGVEEPESEPAELLVDGGETGVIDFEAVAVGAAKTQLVTLQIQNISGGEVPGTKATGIGLSTSSSEFTVLSEDCPSTLEPGVGESCEVEVSFAPISKGEDIGTLSLSYTDGFDEFQITTEASGLKGSGEIAGTVRFISDGFNGSEAEEAATITLKRSVGSDGPVTATVTASAVSDGAGTDDFTGTTFTASWADGEDGEQTISLPIVDDELFEGPEGFTVTISDGGAADIGEENSATVTIVDNDDAPVAGTVQFSSNSYNGSEAEETATITLTRSVGSDGPVTATVTASAVSDGAGADDFTGTTFTASWADGEDGAQTISIPIVDDELFEGPENFIVTIRDGGEATIGENSSATVTLADNDDAPEPGTVQFASADYNGSEKGETAAITLTRTVGSAGLVTATVTATPIADGASTEDFNGTTFTVSWADGEDGDQTISIPIVDDELFEGSEDFTVRISDGGEADIGEENSATVTIADNDDAPEPGTVRLSSDSYNGSEAGETAIITLTRTVGSDGPVTVTVTASALGEESSDSAGTEDFTGTTFTATWADGEDGDQTISIPIVDDELFEGPEDFTIEISDAGAADVGEESSATVTIADNDDAPEPGTVQFSSDSYNGSEEGETATITLTRTVGSAGPVTATVTATPIADEASVEDFTGTTFTVSWADGEDGEQTISISIVDDELFEGPEDFAIEISDGGAADIGEGSSATVTIADNDDTPEPGTVQFSSDSYNGSEAGEIATITLTRTVGSAGPVTATVTATPIADEASVEDFTGTTFTATWADGEDGDQTISIPIVNDELFEGPEDFVIEISDGGAADIGEENSATVTIADNDDAPLAGTVQFSSDNYNGSEAGETATITLTRTVGSDGQVTATVTATPIVDGAGTDDFTGTTFTVSWADGEDGDQTISIPIVDDELFEGPEDFAIEISDGGTAEIGEESGATVTITDNDELAPASLTMSDVVVDFGTLDLADLPATIDTSFAIKNSDAPNTQTATALSVTTSAPFEVVANSCADADIPSGAVINCDVSVTFNTAPAESYSAPLRLSFDGGTTESESTTINVGSVTGVVMTAGDFAFASATFSAPESQGQIDIPVDRSNGSDGAQSVLVSISAVTASRPLDFDVLAVDGVTLMGDNQASIQFADGESTRLLRLEIKADNELEDVETLEIALADGTPQTDAGVNATMVSIIDSSDAGELTFASEDFTVDEAAGELSIDVTRSASAGGGAVAGDLTLSWSLNNGSATIGLDLKAQSGQVEWAADDSGVAATGVRSITVSGIVADTFIEGTETFNLILTAGGEAASRIELPKSPTISIVDSTQVLPVELALAGGSTVTVAEDTAGTVQIEVTRGGDLQSEVSLPYVIGGSEDTAIADDHNAVDGVLFWASGDASSKFIEIPVVNDSVPELTETLSINFGLLSNPATAFWPSTLSASDLPPPPIVQHPVGVTVSITDADALLLADDDPDNPLVLLQVLSELEVRAVNPPLLLAPFEVRAVQVTTPELPQCAGTNVDELVAAGCTQPVAGADVSWTVFPDPNGRPGDVAEIITPDGIAHLSTVRTVANDEGIASVQANVLRRGFIGIRATPTLNIISSKSSAQLDRGIRAVVAPVVPSAVGDVVFTIRAGLETTVGFSTNQARLGAAIDGICDAVDNNEVAAATTAEEASLYTLCDLENETEANEVLNAINALLPEEYFTIADASVDLADLQITNIYTRILAIRSKLYGREGRNETAQVDLSGLALKLYGESIPSIVPDTAINHALGTGGSSGSNYVSPWGFFANGSLAMGEAENSENEVGQDFSTRGLTAGVDYMVDDNIVLGAAVGVTRHSSDFRGQQGANDLDGTYLSFFGTYFNPNHGYVDAILELGTNSYELSRQINLNLSNPNAGSLLQDTDALQIADGKTSANSAALTIGAGFDKNVKGYQIGPYGRLSLTHADVDGFAETARFQDRPGIGYVLRLQDHSIRSVKLALGGQFSKTINTRRGIFLPQLRIEAELENEKRPESITSSFRFDPTDQEFTIDGDENDRFVVNYSVGGSAIFKNGKSGFLFYEGQAGHETVSQHRVKGGFRLEF